MKLIFSLADEYFTTLRTSLTSYPVDQDRLFDSDDNTCVTVQNFINNGIGSLTMVFHWNPAAKNGIQTNTATYWCKTDFYVSVLHDPGIRVSVLKGTNHPNNINGLQLSYRKCPLVNHTIVNGMRRSKFVCHCDSKCGVLIKFLIDTGIDLITSRLCGLEVFD